MIRTIRMVLPAAVLAVVVLVIGSVAHADVTITMKNEMSTPMGKQTTTITQYYRPTKMRSEYGETSVMIMDLDEGRILTLMPTAKKFLQRTFEQMKKDAAMMKLAKPEITIEETDEEEEISGYTCHKVIVHSKTAGMETVTENWVTKDVEGLDDVKAFTEAMYEALKEIPQQRANMEASKELTDKGYFPIRTVIKQSLPGGEATTTMTVTKIEEGDVDDELFEVPEGYEEMKMGGFTGFGE